MLARACGLTLSHARELTRTLLRALAADVTHERAEQLEGELGPTLEVAAARDWARALTVLESGVRAPASATLRPQARSSAPAQATQLLVRGPSRASMSAPANDTLQIALAASSATTHAFSRKPVQRPWANTPRAQSLASGVAADFGKDMEGPAELAPRAPRRKQHTVNAR